MAKGKKGKLRFVRTGRIIDVVGSDIVSFAESEAINSKEVVEVIMLCSDCERPLLPKSQWCVTCDPQNARIK